MTVLYGIIYLNQSIDHMIVYDHMIGKYGPMYYCSMKTFNETKD